MEVNSLIFIIACIFSTYLLNYRIILLELEANTDFSLIFILNYRKIKINFHLFSQNLNFLLVNLQYIFPN